MSDSESGIMSRACKKFLSDNGVNHYTTNSPTHCAFIERYWRDLKNRLARHYFRHRTHQWVAACKDIIHARNRMVTRAHGETPYDVVHDPAAAGRALIRMFSYKDYKTNTRPLKVGSPVRISTIKRTFQKEGSGGWSMEIFKVDRIKKVAGEPYMYMLKDEGGEDIDGAFYRDELQVVKMPTDGNRLIDKIVGRRRIKGVPHVLVRWLGLGAKFNSYVPANSIEEYTA